MGFCDFFTETSCFFFFFLSYYRHIQTKEGGKESMAKTKVGITLTEEILQKLEEFCKEKGLNKSQAISLAISELVSQKGEKVDK